MNARVGIVAIGRNEGERLLRCLLSLKSPTAIVVYVDSGSTDDSVTAARSTGADVVQLDLRTPFTAARARNMGLQRLLQLASELQYVQFIDGDCEISPTWIEAAVDFMEKTPAAAIVCGRRRERAPAKSIYNWLCDIEWNTRIGETKACGGDALARVGALAEVGGYRADLIAGEEPELCFRLRSAGWQIWRLDCEMTLHDAGMTRFDQWWRRAFRSGYAIAQGAHLHGVKPERYNVWESRRAWFWGLLLPIICMIMTFAFFPWGTTLWLLYPLQILRRFWRNIGSSTDRLILAYFQTLARFPEALGQMAFMRDYLLGRTGKLIEYK